MIQGYLNIIVGIPVRIVDDDRVGRVQVDAETTGFGANEEHEFF